MRNSLFSCCITIIVVQELWAATRLPIIPVTVSLRDHSLHCWNKLPAAALPRTHLIGNVHHGCQRSVYGGIEKRRRAPWAAGARVPWMPLALNNRESKRGTITRLSQRLIYYISTTLISFCNTLSYIQAKRDPDLILF